MKSRGQSAAGGGIAVSKRRRSQLRKLPALSFLILPLLATFVAGTSFAATTTQANFDVSPAAQLTGQPITLDASSSTCANTPCTYVWNVTASGTSWSLGSGQVLTHAFGRSGPKVVTLTVTDASGQTDTDTQSFVVSVPGSTGPATDTASFTFSPSSPVTGQAVTFNASTSTCASAPCTYVWDDDGPDGSAGSSWPLGSGQVLTSTFQGAGTKYVRLTITDANGQTATIEHNAVVGYGGSSPSTPSLTPPSNTGLPAISGATTQGQVVSSSNGSWAGNPTSFAYQWQNCDASGANCASISGATGAAYTLAAQDIGHTIRSVVNASNAAGSAQAVSSPTGVVAGVVSGGGQQTLNCFSSPGGCGYPDPAYGNVGVPAGTMLSASGSLVVTTPGAVIQSVNVTGTVTIAADNVTVKNSRIALGGGGCGPTSPCGTYDITINAGVTGTSLQNLELTNAAGTTVQHAVYNHGSDTGTSATGLYQHSNTASGGGTDSLWWGPGTIKDSYAVAGLFISADHIEDIYQFAGQKLDVEHDTLLNPVPQTATVFVDGKGGASNVTINDNLLAGGGFTLYPAANSGSGTATITNNHFARCLSPEVQGSGGTWLCQGGADSHGYYPKGGSFGPVNSEPPQLTWSGNVWDDNGATVGP